MVPFAVLLAIVPISTASAGASEGHRIQKPDLFYAEFSSVLLFNSVVINGEYELSDRMAVSVGFGTGSFFIPGWTLDLYTGPRAQLHLMSNSWERQGRFEFALGLSPVVGDGFIFCPTVFIGKRNILRNGALRRVGVAFTHVSGGISFSWGLDL